MYKIELPNSYEVGSRGVTVTVDVTKLSPAILAELALHGLTQKVADAASQAKSVAEETGATVEAVTLSSMQKAVDSLIAGDWTRRTSGGGVDEETRIARLVTRQLVKAKFGSKSPDWTTFTGLPVAEQNEKLDAWFAANEEALAPQRDAELARRAEAAKGKKVAAKAVTFAL